MEYVKSEASLAHPRRELIGKVEEPCENSYHRQASEPALQKEQRSAIDGVIGIILREIDYAECNA